MKMNRIKLHKQVETMNKEQLIVLCKSLIDINCELEDRIDKAIEFLEHEQFKRIQLGFGRNKYLENIKNKAIDILRGEDNDSKRNV